MHRIAALSLVLLALLAAAAGAASEEASVSPEPLADVATASATPPPESSQGPPGGANEPNGVVDHLPADLRAFSFTFVVYHHGDPIGFVLSLFSLSPVFIMVSYATLIVSRRDLRTISLCLGQLVNEVLNTVLKHLIAQPRPDSPAVRAQIGITYGMPSDHAMFYGFLVTNVLLFAALRWRARGVEKTVLVSALLALALLSLYSRVYLGYHTVLQILVGSMLGCAFGFYWFYLTETQLRRKWWSRLTESRLGRLLLVRDCSAAGDILQAEYDATRQRKKFAV